MSRSTGGKQHASLSKPLLRLSRRLFARLYSFAPRADDEMRLPKRKKPDEPTKAGTRKTYVNLTTSLAPPMCRGSTMVGSPFSTAWRGRSVLMVMKHYSHFQVTQCLQLCRRRDNKTGCCGLWLANTVLYALHTRAVKKTLG